MLNKKILMLAIFAVSLFAISAVSAADNVSDVVSNEIGSFNQLDELINEDLPEISLETDYVHDSYEEDFIYISEGKTVDGKGHVIDGNGHGQIFYSSEDNIIVKNLVIKNTKKSEDIYYGPIYFEGNNCTLDNCTFINNNGEFDLITFEGMKGTVKNCKFQNNNADGLIDINNDDYTVSSCEFIDNTVGIAIHDYVNSVNIKDCNFENNAGQLISLSENTVIDSCNFNNNEIKSEYVSFIEVSKGSTITNCNFNGSKFKPDEEYSIICLFDGDCSVLNCNFTNNDVKSCIKVNYDTGKDTISNCNFENNLWDFFADTNEYTIVKGVNFKNNNVRNSIFKEFSGAIVNHEYVLGVYYIDSNGFPLSKQKVRYTIGSKSYEKTTDKHGYIEIVYKTFGSNKLALTNPVTKQQVTSQLTLYKIFDKNKDVTKYYKSSTTYKVRVFNYKGKLAKGETVRFDIKYNSYYSKVDKNGYATLKLNQKPGTYMVSAKYGEYYVTNKITIKSPIITKNVNKKVKKAGKFTVKILNGKGKAFAKQLVKINLKGKTYKFKTNSNGIATLNIPKNLKAGKYTIKTTYNGYTVSNKLTVK